MVNPSHWQSELSPQAPAITGPAAPTRTVALATPQQQQAEQLALRLLADGEVLEILKDLRVNFAADAMMSRPLGASRFHVALGHWTRALITREAAGDFQSPRILWAGDTTPRTWLGHTYPGSALASDNPDAGYRFAFIDGAAQYEIRGRFPTRRPAHFSIEPLPGLAGVIPASGTLTGAIGTTTGPALLTDQDLQCEPDGSFAITLSSDAASGPNHLALSAQPMAINFRDVFSDWTQQPVPLSIRRVSKPTGPALDAAEIRRRTLEHMPAFLTHWVTFKDRWLGGFEPNTYKGPFGRAGAWSYILAGRYALEPGQVIVMRTSAGGAKYHGVQVTDHWQISLNNAYHQSSLNNAQVTLNRDGSATYVIAPEDPGYANWLDTEGCLDGRFLARWQVFGPDFKADQVMHSFEVLDRAALERRSDIPRVTPEQRHEQLARRVADYATRING